MQEQYVSSLLDLAQAKADSLLKSFYDEVKEDVQQKKSEDIASITAENALDMAPFYALLTQLRQHHRPMNAQASASLSLATAMGDIIPVRKQTIDHLEGLFSGEEHAGKYLDLNSLYLQYCNLKGVPSRDYLSFIDLLDNFDNITTVTKRDDAYLRYLNDVNDYLLSFYKRAKPLVNIEELLASHASDKYSVSLNAQQKDDPLYCQACQKSFAKDTVFQAHLSGKKHLKSLEQPKSPSESSLMMQVETLEANIRTLYGPLKGVKNATIANLERKQSLTAAELALEDEEAAFDEMEVMMIQDEETDEASQETDKFYNPLKLPLGWDGKPIPYWLYKLHGLSVSYTCEICGNYTYMGRKAFEKHFQVSCSNTLQQFIN